LYQFNQDVPSYCQETIILWRIVSHLMLIKVLAAKSMRKIQETIRHLQLQACRPVVEGVV